MKNLLLIFTVSMLIGKVYSQADTVLITKEGYDLSEEKYDKFYKLFIEDKNRNINHLWKLDLLNIGVTPGIGFEGRIFKPVSTESYLRLYQLKYSTPGPNLSIKFEQGFKYYYNLKRREQKGKRISGFSANYFTIGALSSYSRYSRKSSLSDARGVSNLNYKHENIEYGGFIYWGMQRRIGNVAYIDGFFGIRIHEIQSTSETNDSGTFNSYISEASLTVGIRAGFAIDSFKELKSIF